ncbi:MAG TPA: NADH-quinone oxidoreductase subunit L [Methylophilus sp.]|nr:NADH-quinone oxidoreductase subunit L [Methylophilus sp.]HQQ33211.1 NADH-quinone oxidoreductase subunit L [Methylophilus sp.]
MDQLVLFISGITLAPPLFMAVCVLLAHIRPLDASKLWRDFSILSVAALLSAFISLFLHIANSNMSGQALMSLGLKTSQLQAWVTVLVILLGIVIGIFSARYLQGEPRQANYIAAFSGVLAAVNILLLADHWVILVCAWALIGVALQHLLCFYPERPFATLAAHKKQIADRVADALLITAAGLAWLEVGNGSLTAMFQQLSHAGISMSLHLSALCLVLAVVIRTALFPVHGWLVQVMEAPTPVSALLHAGVVNLAGFVLIRFAPLLEAAHYARWLLVVFGLVTAVLAGLVMLTRVSVKVRLAWSTVAQMGFMILECGLGLYTLAFMHLIGHSLYKAHAFLSASSIVQQNKIEQMRDKNAASTVSLVLAPFIALAIILAIQEYVMELTWPWWWSAILALAWAPILWAASRNHRAISRNLLTAAFMIASLTILAALIHNLPLGTFDMVDTQAGVFALLGMTVMYLLLVALQLYPANMGVFQRWSYAGFYVDEAYTRLALKLWPIDWVSADKPHQSVMTDRQAI